MENTLLTKIDYTALEGYTRHFTMSSCEEQSMHANGYYFASFMFNL
jgi:hypothetical protein